MPAKLTSTAPWSVVQAFEQGTHIALALLELEERTQLPRPRAVHQVTLLHEDWTFGKVERVWRQLVRWGCVWNYSGEITEVGGLCSSPAPFVTSSSPSMNTTKNTEHVEVRHA